MLVTAGLAPAFVATIIRQVTRSSLLKPYAAAHGRTAFETYLHLESTDKQQDSSEAQSFLKEKEAKAAAYFQLKKKSSPYQKGSGAAARKLLSRRKLGRTLKRLTTW